MAGAIPVVRKPERSVPFDSTQLACRLSVIQDRAGLRQYRYRRPQGRRERALGLIDVRSQEHGHDGNREKSR